MAASKFSVQSFDLKHYAKTEAYARAVQALFDSATRDIMRMKQVGTFDPNKPFSWNDYPQAKAEMEKITLQLATRVVGVIERGSREEWLSSCKKNDAWLDSIMDTSKLSKEHLRQFQDRRLDALQAFQERKVGGLDLSQRVWKYVAQYKENLEDGIDLGLGKGTSADVLSREVRQYLRDPDMYFRRFRVKVGTDESGQTIYGRKWKRMVKTADGVRWIDEAPSDYHPGQGVYRSSYKNAMRLTRSEINMAYRESDWQHWQQLDFVVGFEIHRSNHEPQFKCKLCDRLTGRYPKNFRFIGWHPQCRCYVTPIIADRETFNSNELSDLKAALRGGTAQHQQAKNAVVKMPDNFTQWAEETAAKVAAGEMSIKSTPYFIRDNFTAGDIMQGVKPEVEQYNPLLSMSEAQSIVEMARKRHAARTQQQIEDIRQRWEEHNKSIELTKKQAANILKVAPEWVDVDASELVSAVASGDVNRMKSATQNVVAQIKQQQTEEKSLSDIIPDVHSWHKQFAIAELQSVKSAVEANLTKWSSLSTEELCKKLRFEAIDFLKGNMKGVQSRYATWEVSEFAYLKKLQETAEKWAAELIAKDRITEARRACDYYADAILEFAKKDYTTQKPIFSTTDRDKSQKAFSQYIKEKPINPHSVWGGNIGGIWSGMSYQRQQYAMELTNITADELSLVTRFTSGMTFYNAYNLRKISAFWARMWNDKMSMLTPDEVKLCERVIKKYTLALDSITERLVRYDGIVYRGVHSEGGGELIAQFQKAWKSKKKTWTNTAAASSSTDIGVSYYTFDDRGTNDLIMIIHNKTGGYIRPVSHYDYEKEVLLIRNTEYKLLKAPWQQGGKWFVELEEIVRMQ